MRTLRKEPGKPWEIVEVPNELEALQKAVGGHLERVTFASDICVLCDKEALCKGLPHNTDICGTVEFFGTVLIVGMANGEFVSLSEQQVEDLWEMGRCGGVIYERRQLAAHPGLRRHVRDQRHGRRALLAVAWDAQSVFPSPAATVRAQARTKRQGIVREVDGR